MFVSDSIVFTELHKTGGTHIGKWLSRLSDGQQIGKHNRIPQALRDRFILGSVRNPWDWYVSLWAFGCSGQGSVHRQVTRRLDLPYLRRQLAPEMGRHRIGPRIALRQLWQDAIKPAGTWRMTYRDSSDAIAFRRWLAMILDPVRRFDVAEGFGFSPVSDWAGLMTYRYLKLFSHLDERLYTESALATPAGTRQLWEQHRLVDFVIRTEHLEDDLMRALALAGVPLNDIQRRQLEEARNRKTNASKRLPMAHYYDAAAVALIAEKEALIIDQYEYRPPPVP